MFEMYKGRSYTARPALIITLGFVLLSVPIIELAGGRMSAAPQQESAWQKVTFGDEEFSVLLPGHLTSRTSALQWARKEPLITAKYEYDVSDTYYAVHSIFDFIDDPKLNAQKKLNLYSQVVLQSIVESLEKKGQSVTVSRSRPLVLNGFPGREVQLLNPDGTVRAVVRYYLTKLKFYSLLVAVPVSRRVDADRVLSSFSLTPSQIQRPMLPVAGVNIDPSLYRTNLPENPRDVTTKAKIILRPQPAYTTEARDNQVSGTVILRAVLSANGKVTNISALSHLPYGLTERAIAAARRIKFTPAMKGGHRVSQYVQLEYNFDLYENPPK
jgi:TonB family protein